MEERGHTIKVLKEVVISLKREDFFRIKELSNEIIHVASIEQDPDIISAAVIIYSLSKLLQRNEFRDFKSWPSFYKKYIENIKESIIRLEKKDIEGFRKCIVDTRKLIEDQSGSLKSYISDVFRKAQINKASKIYEHGISMEKTAKILGISIWELAEYSGQIRSDDQELTLTMPIKDRISVATEVFR
jgi:hypothetical protein